MRAVRVIDDVATLKAMADPTRAGILELLTEPRSVTELARALDVPRTRLYHHIELLRDKGLVEQVDERRVGALTERIYALTAKTFRASARLVHSGDPADRVDALTTLLFDTTKADLKLSLEASEGERSPRPRPLDCLLERRGRPTVHRRGQKPRRALLDAAHATTSSARPYALVWALYPSSRTIS